MTEPYTSWQRPLRPIRERELRLFRSLVERETGIFLGPSKKALVSGRLAKRLRALGLTTFDAYYRTVCSDRQEAIRMLDCLCTNETSFFREQAQFEYLEQQVLKRWQEEAAAGLRPRRVRVWSAACATGEEPYSLAMTLLWHLSGWQIEIIASDLSTQALEHATTGHYAIERAVKVPEAYRKRFMLKGVRSQAGKVAVAPELRSVVRFERLNLADDSYPHRGAYDLLFCRNVMIYFRSESRAQTVTRLLRHLASDGYLFLGHSESLNGVTDRVRCVIPNVYTWSQASDR
jgi:chemotaxis protein methyltransferase CheR